MPGAGVAVASATAAEHERQPSRARCGIRQWKPSYGHAPLVIEQREHYLPKPGRRLRRVILEFCLALTMFFGRQYGHICLYLYLPNRIHRSTFTTHTLGKKRRG